MVFSLSFLSVGKAVQKINPDRQKKIRGIRSADALGNTLTAKILNHVVTILLLCLVLPTTAFSEDFAEDRVVAFDIPHQPAGKSLKSFAQQTNLAVIFPQKLVASISTPELRGHFTVSDGLEQLLDGTDLSGQITVKGSILIQLRPAHQNMTETQQVNEMEKKKQKNMMLSGTAAAIVAALSATPAIGQEQSDDANKEAEKYEQVVVTGVRGTPRTVTQSPTPIDVIQGDKLENMLGSEPMRDVLSRLVPSFQAMNVASSSWNSIARPASLRGLSGSHILVLVNGKRRHNSSLIDFNSGSVGRGANPVDMDLIPASAIKRVEILRDGAAAQYGSDAVAGVINIILKDNAEGGNINASAGQRADYRGTVDGQVVTFGGSTGFGIDEDGSSTWSFQTKNAQKAVRNGLNTYVNDYVYQGGLPAVKSVYISQNTVVPLKNVTLYSTGTYAQREAEVGQNFRNVGRTSVITEIYPDGYAPNYAMDETDFELSAGVKGMFAKEWDWDLSTVYGHNEVDHQSTNSLNASLGRESPTEFRTYTSEFNQWTSNFDATRAYYVDDKAVQLSFGFEHRFEEFNTFAGDPEAYENGGYVFSGGTLDGQLAPVGAQAAIVVTPDDEADADRNVMAAYAEASADLSDVWSVTGAVRFEHYDDSAGNVFSGKLNTRYEVSDDFALRATISNGFRAPSLSQANFGRTSTQFIEVEGEYQEVKSRLVKVDSDVGQSLGSQELDPEKSLDLSAGFTWSPAEAWDITVDGYRIAIDDLVQLTGLMKGDGVSEILSANGLDSNMYVQYFANAIDMTTTGVDVVSTYKQDLEEWGGLNYTVAANYNKNEIDSIAETPAVLEGLGLTLYDRKSQGYIEKGTPNEKIILGLEWMMDALTVSVRETWYGGYDVYSNSGEEYDEHYGGKWITDLTVTYKATDSLTVSGGANNLFDTYPDAKQGSNPYGFAPYASNSPFGHYGAFYFVRANYAF